MLKSYQLTACFLSLVILTACESDVSKAQNEAVERLLARRDSIRRDSIARPTKPALAVNPCSKPRPYKNWTNAQLNVAQVEYMGTPQSMELIREAACRTE